MGYRNWWRSAGGGVVTALLIVVAPVAAQQAAAGEHAGIPVRFAEGAVHGFLELRNAGGTIIAHGELLQRPSSTGVLSVLRLRFADGSFFEETTDFTQREVLGLQRYHLVQRGPSFEHDLDASLSRTGRYHVVARDRKDGEREVYDGTLELEADIANGLVIILAKNLDPRRFRRVQLVAFTPKPRLVELEFVPAGTAQIRVGAHTETAQRFALKPRLGSLVGFFAKLLGKHPPDSYAWIVTDEVPAFLRFEGPMYLGPAWRLDLATPSWPK